MPQTSVCGFFDKSNHSELYFIKKELKNRKKQGFFCHYHQLSHKKYQGNEQTAELSFFVKLQWNLRTECVRIQM